MLLLKIIFFLCCSIIFYVYFAYPVLVWLIGVFKRKGVEKADIYPMVTIITSAYNEAEHIEATIRNKFGQEYPEEKLEYVVVSDASTDGTDDIVVTLQASNQKLQFIRQETRQGKTAALNRAVQHVRGQWSEVSGQNNKTDHLALNSEHILVFSDANSMYKPDALKKLVRNFADSGVGYVTGKMVYVTKADSGVSEGCSAYMKYENTLRTLETRIGSIVGVDGGIDAVRMNLYDEMEAEDLPDFVLPLSVVEKGYRVVFESEAILQEDALKSHESEFNMRVRVALRSYQTIFKKMNLLQFSKFGLFSWELLSHKVFRYDVGFYQVLILLLNIMLFQHGFIFRFSLVCQEIFYALALLGYLLEKKGKQLTISYVPYYFCLLNLASIVAFWQFISGTKKITWNPREG